MIEETFERACLHVCTVLVVFPQEREETLPSSDDPFGAGMEEEWRRSGGGESHVSQERVCCHHATPYTSTSIPDTGNIYEHEEVVVVVAVVVVVVPPGRLDSWAPQKCECECEYKYRYGVWRTISTTSI
jgi:hypothetical protein